jgi:hypothetical protein
LCSWLNATFHFTQKYETDPRLAALDLLLAAEGSERKSAIRARRVNLGFQVGVHLHNGMLIAGIPSVRAR